jgi:hypothetical protein
MSNGRKAIEELRRIDDAIDESILSTSAKDLREELAEEGVDPDKVIAEMDAITRDAKIAGAKMRLMQAKESVASLKTERTNVQPGDRIALRAKLRRMRSGGKSGGEGLMMAARKGKQLSPSDEEGALDDLAELESLETLDDGASEE